MRALEQLDAPRRPLLGSALTSSSGHVGNFPRSHGSVTRAGFEPWAWELGLRGLSEAVRPKPGPCRPHGPSLCPSWTPGKNELRPFLFAAEEERRETSKQVRAGQVGRCAPVLTRTESGRCPLDCLSCKGESWKTPRMPRNGLHRWVKLGGPSPPAHLPTCRARGFRAHASLPPLALLRLPGAPWPSSP